LHRGFVFTDIVLFQLSDPNFVHRFGLKHLNIFACYSVALSQQFLAAAMKNREEKDAPDGMSDINGACPHRTIFNVLVGVI
jgi:hypothetical protein